ncbi:MAG: hypothetical protein C0483_07975 [Pirellula sp.]|nr:hypothetical protein [Pirellula sp.]
MRQSHPRGEAFSARRPPPPHTLAKIIAMRMPLLFRRWPFWFWLPTVLCLLLAAPLEAADDEEDEDDVGLPGLTAVHSPLDTKGSAVKSVVDPMPQRLSLSLAAGESPHPTIAPGPFQTTFTGRVFVQRPGKYLFRADLHGKLKLAFGDQVAFDGVVGDGETIVAGTPVTLKYGQVPLTATFERTDADAPAELRLFWQREGEAEFAVPSAVLSRAKPVAGKPETALPTTSWEEGRRLVSEHRCAACHEIGALSSLSGTAPVPRAALLPGIGDRISEAWMHRWLANPKAVRRLATMPDLFGDSPAEQADLYAATKYLASLKDPKKSPSPPPSPQQAGATEPNKNIVVPDAVAVRKSMAAVGCVACHTLPGEDIAKFPDLRPLTNLGDKTTAAVLEKRIAEPRAYHPSSRMPDFQLKKEQPKLLRDIAAYLADQHAAEALPTPKAPAGGVLEERWNTIFAGDNVRGKFEKMSEDERWRVLGSRVVETRGCLNCHDFDKRQTKLTPPPSLAGISAERMEQGCVAEKPQAPAASYSFTPEQQKAIRGALALSPQAKPAKAPIYAAQRELQRSGCTNCHSSGAAEGAFAKRILSFVQLGTDQTLHDLAPPNLAGIGEKLNVKAMQSVIDGKTRARPWMALRMPIFGEENVKGLGTSLAAQDGVSAAASPAAEATAEVPVSDEDIEIGRQLIGRTGLNCVSCHDIRGIPSIGVRGPDLAKVAERVREEWFHAWLMDPQRFTPGTRMPSVFFGGKSAAPQFLEGDPERQINALWAYLSQGSKMELPSLAPPANAVVPGGENPHFMPKDRPLIVRGFMPEVAGLRGIALGTPAGTHFAFDSERCVLTAAWTGDFAEIGGWFDNGRGTPVDNALKPLGKMIWRAPTESRSFAAEGADPAFLPSLKFSAAWADAKDAGFSYAVEVVPGKFLHVEERLAPLPDGFERRFTLRADDELPALRLQLSDGKFVGDISAEASEEAKGVLGAGDVPELVLEKFAAKMQRSVVVQYKLPARAEKSEKK